MQQDFYWQLLIASLAIASVMAQDCEVSDNRDFVSISGQFPYMQVQHLPQNDPSRFMETLCLQEDCSGFEPTCRNIKADAPTVLSIAEVEQFNCGQSVTTSEETVLFHYFEKLVTAKPGSGCENEENLDQPLQRYRVCIKTSFKRDQEVIVDEYTTEVLRCDDCQLVTIPVILQCTIAPEQVQEGDLVSLNCQGDLVDSSGNEVALFTMPELSVQTDDKKQVLVASDAAQVSDVFINAGPGSYKVIFRMPRLDRANPFQQVVANIKVNYFPDGQQLRRSNSTSPTGDAEELAVRSLAMVVLPKDDPALQVEPELSAADENASLDEGKRDIKIDSLAGAGVLLAGVLVCVLLGMAAWQMRRLSLRRSARKEEGVKQKDEDVEMTTPTATPADPEVLA